MAAAVFISLTLPSPPASRPRIPTWAVARARPNLLPVSAAAGKGFGEFKKQKKRGKSQEASSSSPSLRRDVEDKRDVKAENKTEPSPHVLVDELEEKTICPCGGGEQELGYSQCCMPFHDGTAFAPDALTLLRARYSAFAKGIVGYIVRTTHPESPDNEENLPANALRACDQLRFFKLQIMHHEPINEQQSNVSYRITFGQRGKNHRERKFLEEKSLFVREGGTWLFQDGEVLSRSSEAGLKSFQ